MLLSFLNILRALVWLYGVSPKLLDYLYPALSLRFSFPFILLVRFRNTFLIRCQKKKKEKERKKGKEWLIEARDFSWSVLGWLYLQLSQLALHFHAFIWEPKEERSPSPELSALLLFTLILQLWMLLARADTALSGWVGLKWTWKHYFHCSLKTKGSDVLCRHSVMFMQRSIPCPPNPFRKTNLQKWLIQTFSLYRHTHEHIKQPSMFTHKLLMT